MFVILMLGNVNLKGLVRKLLDVELHGDVHMDALMLELYSISGDDDACHVESPYPHSIPVPVKNGVKLSL
jgi:hypothetical protein